VEAVKRDYRSAPISAKLAALLTIAGQVQRGGKRVTAEAVRAAVNAGATDVEVHDTVLIAAAFCMYNRYVDGLATLLPADAASYDMVAKKIVADGYRAAVAQV
jgi:alkylhydroperoxidase/carboxymuconolactone decarboxylase family protein YurZ